VGAVDDLQTLRDKGFRVNVNDDGTASICWPNADPKTTFKVLVQSGMLLLVPDRSATHKMLAKELSR
jgi:hypothetical protein